MSPPDDLQNEKRLYILRISVPVEDGQDLDEVAPIRIGVSGNLISRIKRHQSYWPYRVERILDVPCMASEERWLHRMLEPFAMQYGAEFYTPDPVVRWLIHLIRERWTHMARRHGDLGFISELYAEASALARAGISPPRLLP